MERLTPGGGPGEEVKTWFTIAGMAGDVRERGLQEKPVEAMRYE